MLSLVKNLVPKVIIPHVSNNTIHYLPNKHTNTDQQSNQWFINSTIFFIRSYPVLINRDRY